ncbi:MAG: EamA family transporter [Bacteroidales bacterium]|nr:EamA family transporter [Bacteroidales bacterium]
MLKLIILGVTQALLMCGTQSFFKLAADKMSPIGFTWKFMRDGVFLNGWLWLSAVSAVVMLAEWVYMLRHYPFSQIYPLQSLSFLFAMIVSVVFFRETVVWTQWVGVFLILAGCALIVR